MREVKGTRGEAKLPALGHTKPLRVERKENGCKRLLLRRIGAMDEALRSGTIIGTARLVMLMSGLLALVPMSAQSAESLQENPTMIKQTIVVEHIRIESAKPFADVHAALERSVPHLDPGLAKALDDGDVERADRSSTQSLLTFAFSR